MLNIKKEKEMNFENICLKLKLRSLKKKKEDKYSEIIINKPRILSKKGDIEEVDPTFFEYINEEISKIERLIEIKKSKNKVK